MRAILIKNVIKQFKTQKNKFKRKIWSLKNH